MFASHMPSEISIPPSKLIAFVFMHKKAAARFLAQYSSGKGHSGRKYFVKYAINTKGEGQRAPAFLPQRLFMAVPASNPIDTERTAASVFSSEG